MPGSGRSPEEGNGNPPQHSCLENPISRGVWRATNSYFDLVTKPELDRPEWPAPRPNPDYAARLVYRKPLTPSEEELTANPRSRSAKLRVIEKL